MNRAKRTANEALVRQFFEAANERDREAFKATMDEGFTYGDIEGPEEMADNDWKWYEALEWTWHVQAMHDGEDFVTTRVRATGTHEGEILGLEPTGESFDVTGMTLSIIEDGDLVEWHSEWDFAGFLNQFGVIDPPVDDD